MDNKKIQKWMLGAFLLTCTLYVFTIIPIITRLAFN
jgi:hypothetical protein